MVLSLAGQIFIVLLRFGLGPSSLRDLLPVNPKSPTLDYLLGGIWGLIPLVVYSLCWKALWPHTVYQAEQQGFPLVHVPTLVRVVTGGFALFGVSFFVSAALAMNAR